MLAYLDKHGRPYSDDLAATAHRVISLDEVAQLYDEADKETFTILYTTGGNGDIYLVMVVFNGTMQPAHHVVTIEGVTFFVAYNDALGQRQPLQRV
jgi:hypothetical protein